MFAVVYSGPAMGPVMFDPEVGMNFATMVHGAQEFEWAEPVCSGDLITTTPRCLEIYEKDGKGFMFLSPNRLTKRARRWCGQCGPTSLEGYEVAVMTPREADQLRPGRREDGV